jgi:hypothetical protein
MEPVALQDRSSGRAREIALEFLKALETSGFSVWVRESGSLWSFPGILLVHTYGMGIMVGVILAIDLSILGFVPALPLAPLQKFFPLVWTAFWLNAITGTILLAADATTKLTNPDFGVKMAFIVLAVINQRMIQKRLFGDPVSTPSPANGKMLAWMSIVCWLGAITAGRLLAYVGTTVK